VSFLGLILKSVLMSILKWLMINIGHSLYDLVNESIRKHDQAKRDAELKKAYDDAVKQDDLKKEAEAVRDIANGRKK